MDALPRIVWHLDDPVADPALVPLYFVAKKAAEHVTVVLSGEGADEFFGGYTIYREPLSLAGGQRPARRRAARPARGRPRRSRRASRARASWSAAPPRSRSATTATPGSSPRRRSGTCCAATTRRCATPTSPRRSTPRPPTSTTSTKMQYVDLYTWLRGDILVKADRMSMAHSLELRVPFLDREVFDVAATLPVELKLPPRSDATKFALRQALQGVVPPADRQPQEARLPDADPGLAARRDVRLGARHLRPLGRRRPARPDVRAAACSTRTSARRPTTPARSGRC